MAFSPFESRGLKLIRCVTSSQELGAACCKEIQCGSRNVSRQIQQKDALLSRDFLNRNRGIHSLCLHSNCSSTPNSNCSYRKQDTHPCLLLQIAQQSLALACLFLLAPGHRQVWKIFFANSEVNFGILWQWFLVFIGANKGWGMGVKRLSEYPPPSPLPFHPPPPPAPFSCRSSLALEVRHMILIVYSLVKQHLQITKPHRQQS